MREGAAHRPVHLRHAPQTIRILYAWIARKMREADFAASHKGQKMFSCGFLPRMRPRLLQLRVECDGRAFKRFETHRTSDICQPCEALCAKEGEAADCVHRLGAVEQGQTFLLFELNSV